jgi:hypothetical protein
MASVLDLLMGEFPGGTIEEMRRKSNLGYTRYFMENGEAVRKNPNNTFTYGRFDSLGQFVPFRHPNERNKYKRERESLANRSVAVLSDTKIKKRTRTAVAVE